MHTKNFTTMAVKIHSKFTSEIFSGALRRPTSLKMLKMTLESKLN